MNYEKAYKEAIERAKHYTWYSTNRNDTAEPIKNAVEAIFPELKESDDEVIRKALIEVLHRLPTSAFEYGTEGGYLGATKEQMLAWLEKQGEKSWSEEDEKRISRIADFIWKNRKGDTDEIYQQEQDVNWLKSLKSKKHWKPSEEQMRVLQTAIRDYGISYEKSILESLYNDLKSL